MLREGMCVFAQKAEQWKLIHEDQMGKKDLHYEYRRDHVDLLDLMNLRGLWRQLIPQ